jgi:hypothetical protein
MEESIIRVECPGCKVAFDVPSSFAGQSGECSECGSIFVIPVISEPEAPRQNITQEVQKVGHTDQEDLAPPPPPVLEVDNTKSQPIKIEDDDSEPTHTVKLTRSSIGMVPDVKDSFKVGLIQKAASASQTHPGDIEAAAIPAPPPAPKSQPQTRKTNVGIPSKQGMPKIDDKALSRQQKGKADIKKPWWSFLLFWKK